MKAVVIDYGIGNVKSMCNALLHSGIEATLSSERNEVLSADVCILPGVGAFAHGMNNLNNYNLVPIIEDFVKTGKLFIGVCLGMQMLLEESTEFGVNKGIGLIKGKVIKLPVAENSLERLPHVSWNTISEPTSGRWNNTLLSNIPPGDSVYFVHTYVASPQNTNNILANCNYGGVDFCAAIQHENIYGFQFHPEKSGETGLSILNTIKQLQ